MANPVNVVIPVGTWTLVATNVIDGVINIRNYQADDYFQTYRVTGDPAPIGDQNEQTATKVLSNEIFISASSAIDVYLFCIKKDGEVVVSL